jgi:hypothetical protein
MSIAGIYISAREFQALAGLSDLQFRLYITMRRFMDFSNGIVGRARGVSWQSFREELYQEPGPGVKGGSPSKDQVRRAADALSRVGLIGFDADNEKHHQLVFKCPLAETDKTKIKKAARPSPQEAAIEHPTKASRANTKPSKVSSAKSAHDVPTEAATPKSEEAATPPGFRGFFVLDTSSSSEKAGNEDDEIIYIYPKNITPGLHEAIGKALAGIDATTGQAIIDELSGQLSAKEIKNPLGYLQTIIKQAWVGEFIPQRGVMVKAGREQQAEISKRIEDGKRAVLEQAKKPVLQEKPRKQRGSLMEVLVKKPQEVAAG